MSGQAIAPRRNPKRARTGTVSYKEITENEDDQLNGDDEMIWIPVSNAFHSHIPWTIVDMLNLLTEMPIIGSS